jgi:hypothetical protein
VVEVYGTVNTGNERHIRIDRLDEGEWLHLLMAEIRADVTSQPSPQAVERIRARILAEMQAPARVAA